MPTDELDLTRDIDLHRIDSLIERAQTFCDLVRLATRQDGEEIDRDMLYDAMHGVYECLSDISDGVAPVRVRARQQLDAEVKRILKGASPGPAAGGAPGEAHGEAKGGAQ